MSTYDQLVLRYWLMVAAYVAVLTLVAAVLVLVLAVFAPLQVPEPVSSEASIRPDVRRGSRRVDATREISPVVRDSTAALQGASTGGSFVQSEAV